MLAGSVQVSTGTKTSLSFQDGPVFTRVHRREGPRLRPEDLVGYVSCEAKGLAYKFARFWALPCEVVLRLGRGVADRLQRTGIQAAEGFSDGNQLAALTLHGLFSHAPRTRPTGDGF